MAAKVLITGFGPFPGAPYNPTGPLARTLARHRPGSRHIRRVAHVFQVSYEAVDRDLPELLRREKPDVLVMFGLAARTRHIRVETFARNAVNRTLRDCAGQRSRTGTIVHGAPAALALRTPVLRLVTAARSAGLPAALSRDAGRYVCNYLCWRAAEASMADGSLRVIAFIHVPSVNRHSPSRRPTIRDLAHAGEAIVRTALASAGCGA